MPLHSESEASIERLSTGVHGLDTILGGGLFRGGVYVVSGRPGAGKTIFANQACFRHAAKGGRALYITLLAENHARMLSHLQSLSFFRRELVGGNLQYLSAFESLAKDGLEGLLRVVQKSARDHKAALVVLDGMVTAEHLARSSVDYKRFIHELQTWCGLMECTVVLLTSTPSDPAIQPEHTMVEGIIEMTQQRFRMRTLRLLNVSKFRGSGVLEGEHSYVINEEGVQVFPRIEALYSNLPSTQHDSRRVSSGVASLDGLMGGGFPLGSTTLLLGPSGSGKTMLCKQFLIDGAERGENGMFFTFFESPADLIGSPAGGRDRITEHLESGRIQVMWQPPTERLMDAMAQELLLAVTRHGVKRVVIDGLVGFRQALPNPDRLGSFFCALAQILSEKGITTIISEETHDLVATEVRVPTQGVEGIFHNILFMRHRDLGGTLQRVISVVKVRDSAHAQGVYEVRVDNGRVVIATGQAENTPKRVAVQKAKPVARSRGKR